jgi:hypothetical protein
LAVSTGPLLDAPVLGEYAHLLLCDGIPPHGLDTNDRISDRVLYGLWMDVY